MAARAHPHPRRLVSQVRGRLWQAVLGAAPGQARRRPLADGRDRQRRVDASLVGIAEGRLLAPAG